MRSSSTGKVAKTDSNFTKSGFFRQDKQMLTRKRKLEPLSPLKVLSTTTNKPEKAKVNNVGILYNYSTRCLTLKYVPAVENFY